MKISKRERSPYEIIIEENARAAIEDLKAVQEYNIMMGNLEDPSEEEEHDNE